MNSKNLALEKKYRQLLDQGESLDEVVGQMKFDELTVMEAIKLVRQISSFDLDKAKQVVTSHECWRDLCQDSAISDEEIDLLISKTQGNGESN